MATDHPWRDRTAWRKLMLGSGESFPAIAHSQAEVRQMRSALMRASRKTSHTDRANAR